MSSIIDSPEFSKITEILAGRAAPKGLPPLSGKQKFAKLYDYLQSCSGPDRTKLLEDVVARADDLPIENLRRLNSKISATIAKKEVAASKHGRRMERLAAASAGTDPELNGLVTMARAEMKRAGFQNLDEFREHGVNIPTLDKAMEEARFDAGRRARLKGCLAAIGLIES
jgi:hypothetical protein